MVRDSPRREAGEGFLMGHENAPVLLQEAGAGTDGDQYVESSALVVPEQGTFASLTRLEREVFVSSLIERAGLELKRAVEAGESADVMAGFKDQAAAIADLSRRLGLSKDAVLDAQVLQRRAERGLGVAIREGQAVGEIARQGQGGGTPPGATSRGDRDVVLTTEFADKDTLTRMYQLTDDVSEEQFESATSEARAEGNVSRNNVIRKIKNLPTFSEQQADKWQTVRDLANDRLTSPQIAKRVGMTEEGLRAGARREGQGH